MQSEWAWRHLGDLFRIHREGINPGAHPAEIFEHYSLPAFDESGGPAIQTGTEIESNKSYLSLPVILVSKLNPRKPRVMLVTGSSSLRRCASTEWIPYTPEIAGVDLVFYKWLFGSTGFSRQLEKVATGSTNSHVRVSPSETLCWNVPHPPLSEQRRIAEILDTLDEAIHKTEQVIAKLQQMKQGLLHDLLTRGINENGELRDPERHPEQFKDSPLGRIPRGWEVLPAEEVCLAVIDCKNRTPPLVEAGHPVVRTPNVRKGRLVHDGIVYTDSLSYMIWTQRGQPRPGDVLITREAPIGEACLLPDGMANACLGQRMMLYRADPSKILSAFMLVALLSPQVQGFLLDKAGGSTVGHVRVGDIRSLPIQIPSMVEQKRIADSFNSAEKRLLTEETGLTKLLTLKQGLMDDLLTGRVRVAVPEEATS
jgi:type I restriction enzyme S subunit